jgi:hypothetical protein
MIHIRKNENNYNGSKCYYIYQQLVCLSLYLSICLPPCLLAYVSIYLFLLLPLGARASVKRFVSLVS